MEVVSKNNLKLKIEMEIIFQVNAPPLTPVPVQWVPTMKRRKLKLKEQLENS